MRNAAKLAKRLTCMCRFFWVYTTGSHAGLCCPKTSVEPGKPAEPACKTCGGAFFKMDGKPTAPVPPPPHSAGEFGDWGVPKIVEEGNADHQLYSQITFPFYDIYLGIVRL